MIRDFVSLPDPKIREKCQEVTAFDSSLKKIIDDLVDTANAQTEPTALGLAAPQIGVYKRVFIARIRNKFRPFINAKILKTSQKQSTYLEGCFSVTGKYGHAIRPAEIDIEAQDKHGKKFKRHYKGLAARITQHEIDHMEGILFIDHVFAQNGKLFRVEKDKKGKEMLVEETND